MASTLGAGFAMGPPELNLGPFRGPPYKGETPLRKNSSARQPRTRLTDSEKQTIRKHFYHLRDEWGAALEAESFDWQRLFDVHWELYKLERQHPWLLKRAA
jgi:hypothetical protein